MGLKGEITCPCCGYKSLQSKGEYDICSICFWEDDPFQRDEINKTGANLISLIEAQSNYMAFSACERDMMKNIRKPNSYVAKGDDCVK